MTTKTPAKPEPRRTTAKKLGDAAAESLAATPATWGRYAPIVRWAALAALVFVLYAPALGGEFIWDDRDIYITDNALLREPDGIYRFWLTNDPPDYYPLTYTTFWLEWKLVGERTWLYHVDNVLLHLATTAMLYGLLRRLNAPFAGFVCLLFAVHPMQLESVAWISQRKTLLGTLLGFAAGYDYLGARSGRSRAAAWRGPLLFFLSLAGKPVLITLPPLLAAYEWFSGERDWRAVAKRTAPYFALSLIFGVIGIAYQQKLIGGVDVRGQSLAERIASLGWAAWFYVGQTLRIDATIFVYPRWNVDAASLVAWLPNVALVVSCWGLWRYRRRLGLLPGAAWATYLVTMFPSLGLADVFYWRYSYVGDHYAYQSLPALLVLGAWAAERIVAARQQLRPAVVVVSCLFAAAACWFTLGRAFVFEKEEYVWEDALRKNPRAFLALSNLGAIRDAQGRALESLALIDRALEVEPTFFEAWLRKADILAEREQWSTALELYRRGAELAPRGDRDRLRGRLGEGVSLYHLGRTAEAEAVLAEIDAALGDAELEADLSRAATLLRARVYLWAVAERRGDANRRNDLLAQIETSAERSSDARLEAAQAWYEVGQASRSLALWGRILGERPDDAEALADAGLTALRSGDAARGAKLLRAAAERAPERITIRSNLGIALMTLGSAEAALAEFREAERLAADDPRITANLALACSMAKRYDEAVAAYRRVLELDPSDFAAKRDLAWLLATSPVAGPTTAGEALRLAQQCSTATGDMHPAALDALAAALALNGRFDEAAATAERAATLPDIGDDMRSRIAARTELYRKREVFREP